MHAYSSVSLLKKTKHLDIRFKALHSTRIVLIKTDFLFLRGKKQEKIEIYVSFSSVYVRQRWTEKKKYWKKFLSFYVGAIPSLIYYFVHPVTKNVEVHHRDDNLGGTKGIKNKRKKGAEEK